MLPEDRLVILVVSNKTKHHVWKLVLCRHRPCFQSGMKLLALLRTATAQVGLVDGLLLILCVRSPRDLHLQRRRFELV